MFIRYSVGLSELYNLNMIFTETQALKELYLPCGKTCLQVLMLLQI